MSGSKSGARRSQADLHYRRSSAGMREAGGAMGAPPSSLAIRRAPSTGLGVLADRPPKGEIQKGRCNHRPRAGPSPFLALAQVIPQLTRAAGMAQAAERLAFHLADPPRGGAQHFGHPPPGLGTPLLPA